MADNVLVNASSGTANVLADELTDGTLGTGKAQYIKVLDGTLDSSNKLVVTSGGAAQVAVVAGSAVIGHVIADTGSTTAVTQATGSNLHAVIDAGVATIGSVKLTDGTNSAPMNSAANQVAATTNGAVITERGARWRVTSTPAVSVVASAVKAAGGAGVRHVCDSISFSGGSTTAPVLTKLNVNLRDGAAGAGTIIWSFTVIVGAATGQNIPPFTASGLNLVGTAATAMTLEFSALLTNLFEDCSMSGFDVS